MQRELTPHPPPPSPARRLAWTITAVLCLSAIPAFAQTNPSAERFPFRQQPIDYFGAETADPVAQLRTQLEAGELQLEFKEPHGYLSSVLTALQIPVESQVLVYSKTSVNARLINPKSPRAIYFNDDIYIGWVAGAPALEISAVDPRKGALFYTVPQQEDAPPRFVRDNSCLLCHASANTLNVPGHVLRSYLTDNDGNPREGFSRVHQNLAVKERWGGWYVTGTHGRQSHLGNLVSQKDQEAHRRDPSIGGNVTDLQPFLDTTRYLTPHSDIVALLVLDHQVTVHNLLARVGYEHAFDRPLTSEEPLLQSLLFSGAAPLADTVQGTSRFAEQYTQQGPRDPQGRSLREFDLQSRLLKYRCSPLIYSQAFARLPDAIQQRLYRRLFDILTGADNSAEFEHLPPAERQAILEILRATLPNLPDYWR